MPAPTPPGPDPDAAAQLAARDAEIAALTERATTAEARVLDVEQRYRTLWRTVSEAANGMLAANHPLP